MAKIKHSPTIHSFIQDLLWYQMTYKGDKEMQKTWTDHNSQYSSWHWRFYIILNYWCYYTLTTKRKSTCATFQFLGFSYLDFNHLLGFVLCIVVFLPHVTSLFSYRYLICQKSPFFVNLLVSIPYGSDNNDPSFYTYSFHKGVTINLVLQSEVKIWTIAP